jgi:hypothetical protein
MKRLIIPLACLLATACASGPPLDPKIVAKPVNMPVASSCVVAIGPEPAYPDTDAALATAPDLYTRVKLLLAGRVVRIARDAVKSAALAGCAG